MGRRDIESYRVWLVDWTVVVVAVFRNINEEEEEVVAYFVFESKNVGMLQE